MRLESGPANGDRNYFLLATVVCLGMFGWFIYDGALAWPAKNLEEARKQLTTVLGESIDAAALPEQPFKNQYDALLASKPTTIEEVRAALGEPLRRKDVAAGEVVEYFASRYGMATVPIVQGRLAAERMSWKTWSKTRDEVVGQFYWALIPLALAFYCLYRLYQALSLRVRIDEHGMTYAGQQIAFANMTALRDYSPKGWIDLYHTGPGGERKLRLDNQKVQKFDEIIGILCQVKGFANPLEEPGPKPEPGDKESSG